MNAFYTREGDTFTPSEFVRGPWDDDACHAGPPAALLTSAVHRVAPKMGISRISFDIPGPIPIVPVTIRTKVLRKGKRIQLAEGSLVAEDGTVLLTARAWMIRIAANALPTVYSSDPPPPPPEASEPFTPKVREEPDIFASAELRAAEGTPFAGSPATVWLRKKVPLVDGERVSPYSDAVFIADWANGFAAIRPFNELIAVNTDLTVYFARPPEGEWVALRSSTISHGRGLGMTDSLVYDASGFVGRSNQSIYFDAP